MKTYDGLSISIIKFITQDIVTASTPKETEANHVSCICNVDPQNDNVWICNSNCKASDHRCGFTHP